MHVGACVDVSVACVVVLCCLCGGSDEEKVAQCEVGGEKGVCWVCMVVISAKGRLIGAVQYNVWDGGQCRQLTGCPMVQVCVGRGRESFDTLSV